MRGIAPLIIRSAMNRNRLDQYDDMPAGMLAYIRQFGWHFNRKMCNWAVSMMKRRNQSGAKEERINPMGFDAACDFFKKYGVVIDNDIAYDKVYVLNMVRADYMKSSIEDEMHMALFVKDYLDDPDGYDGLALTRFVADCIGKGIPIMWEDMLGDSEEASL